MFLGLAQEVHHRTGIETAVLQVGVTPGEEDETPALPLATDVDPRRQKRALVEYLKTL